MYVRMCACSSGSCCCCLPFYTYNMPLLSTLMVPISFSSRKKEEVDSLKHFSLECFSPNFLFIACFLSSENQIEEKEAFYCEKEKHCKKFQFNSAKECKGGISRRLEYKYLSKKYKRIGFLFQAIAFTVT